MPATVGRTRNGKGSSVSRSDQAAALALNFLDVATCSETEGHLEDAKLVESQQTGKSTDNLQQREDFPPAAFLL